MQIDRYTKIGQGKDFNELPYNVRAGLYQRLKPEEFFKLEQGIANEQLMQQVQETYIEWFNESFPTNEQLRKQRDASHRRDAITNLELDIKHNKAQLQKLDKIVEQDGVVPMGLRNTLKAKIEGLEHQLKVLQPETTEPEQQNKRYDPKLKEQAVEQGLDWFFQEEATKPRDEDGQLIEE